MDWIRWTNCYYLTGSFTIVTWGEDWMWWVQWGYDDVGIVPFLSYSSYFSDRVICWVPTTNSSWASFHSEKICVTLPGFDIIRCTHIFGHMLINNININSAKIRWKVWIDLTNVQEAALGNQLITVLLCFITWLLAVWSVYLSLWWDIVQCCWFSVLS